jgi:hypothetical protein
MPKWLISLFRSIHQDFSNAPLHISKSAMQDILRSLDVGDTFAPVLLAFGEVLRIAESGFDCTSFRKGTDGSFGALGTISFSLCPKINSSGEISYLYRFVELDYAGARWKYRQIGVYHRHTQSTGQDFFIFLQPHAQSRFVGRIELMVRRDDSKNTLLAAPLRFHELLLGTYFDGWRFYMQSLAQSFKSEVGQTKIFSRGASSATMADLSVCEKV